ncbi:MAG: guanylate kinase [Clostridia bacterium]|nr:guanylate kinase [Clostridia bacterium]
MSDIASKLVIVSGPSGAGKDTIVNELLKRDSSLSLSVSATSRAPRGNEQNGVEYYFISAKEFLEKSEQGDFIEFARYGSNYYGTLKEDVQKRIDSGKIVILVIEVKGAEGVKKLYPEALSVFIMPPSEEILENRLRARQTEDEETIAKRMCIAKTEIEKSADYDFTVVNDDLQSAVDKVYNIICDNRK